ncbi:MAG: cytochrome P450 [Janthinobacterium lividum]
MKELGCEAAARYPHRDPVFGLDLFLDNVRNLKAGNFLNNFKQRFDKYGQTFQAISMGRISIYTNEPKNLQAVHALNFLDYGVQPIRRAPTLPFMGEGVFTMDGPFWEHSRDLIRATFTRSNVANLPAFEVHFRKFLKLIPTDGEQVDLKPLLYKFVRSLPRL